MRFAEWIIRVIDWFYIRPIASMVSRQTFRYGVCGAITYLLLDPLLYFLIYNYVVAHRVVSLGFVALSPYIAAMVLVFPITFFNGFWLNRNVAFRRSTVPTHMQLLRYTLSIGGSILLNYLGLKFFVEVCSIWPTPSKVLTTFVTVIYSFLAAKYFTFRHAERC